MMDDTTATFPFPAVGRNKITAAFDGGRLSSDGGVMLLAQAERRLGIAERLARFIPDRRDPGRVTHAITDMIRARIFAIACGYEDCNDFGPLRADPAFKLACGHPVPRHHDSSPRSLANPSTHDPRNGSTRSAVTPSCHSLGIPYSPYTGYQGAGMNRLPIVLAVARVGLSCGFFFLESRSGSEQHGPRLLA